MITVGLTSGVLGGSFAVIAPWISTDLAELSKNLTNIIIFSSGICLTAITLVLDQATIGLLRGGLQFWRNAIMAVTKLGALLIVSTWFASRSGLSIYGTWAIGNLISMLVILGFAFSKDWDLHTYFPQWGLLRKLGKSAIGHHALNLSLQITALVLPILVTAVLSVRMNAYFYSAWMLANLAFVGPVSLTMVLFAIVSADRAALVPKTRLTLKLSLWIGLLTAVILESGLVEF